MKTVPSKHLSFILLFVVLSLSLVCFGADVEIRIDADDETVPISPLLYGIFFEDINFAADGGLYAELVQNRSFEYFPIPGGNPLSERYVPLYAWEKVERGDGRCSLRVDKIIPLNRNNPHYLVIDIEEPDDAGVGVMNTGFDGIRIDAGEKYDVSFYARRDGRRGRGRGGAGFTVALQLPDGTVCGATEFNRIGGDWQKFEAVITADKTADNARLVLTTTGRGRLYLDMVSLFPQKTFKGRKNGMQADLGQTLADLKPKFFRFPGGCLVHGQGLENAYRWKDTVGDGAERRGNWNRWGYHQTYGLGYYEYFQLCEDIGAEPLPVLPVGVSCGFTPPYQVAPMDELQPWIDDALDLIEFANGPADSEWGKLRVQMGHPEPFGLDYICLGNEEHDTPQLRERFPHFVRAIRRKYPDIKIIGTSGLGAGIPLYDLMTELDVYSSDEHYYMNPRWYLSNQNRFDNFDRSKPKIFVGEYASEGNTLFNAVTEAAFLTGVERNGDIVDMACYAPLFAHVDHTQWTRANLIWFDKRTVVKTPNYYVQQMFSRNAGDVYVRNTVTAKANDEKLPTIEGGVGIAAWDTAIEIEQPTVNGKQLDPSKWNARSGDFSMQDGRYIQTDTSEQPAISFSEQKFDGDTVTYTVRARKTDGAEGFMLVFGAEDSDNYYWFNVGGWGNTQHGIERIQDGNTSILVQRRGAVRTDTWYTATVELSPGRIRCRLDDEQVFDYEMNKPAVAVSSTLDKDADELIVKLVNPSEEDVNATVAIDGADVDSNTAAAMVIAGAAGARNAIDNPDNVKTQTKQITVDEEFDVILPAMSVQFIRIKVDD